MTNQEAWRHGVLACAEADSFVHMGLFTLKLEMAFLQSQMAEAHGCFVKTLQPERCKARPVSH